MRFGALIVALWWGLGAAPGLAAESRPWARLSAPEQAALAPLASAWDAMPPGQRAKLLNVARGYPKLAPQQQRLLHSRLRSWAGLSSEERQIARDNYRKIQALPQADQARIRQQWLDSLCQEFGGPGQAPAAPSR
jgi:hypothetical protein